MALTQLKTSGIADDAVTGAKIADDTVAEANMANDAISLTELKAGTDGQIITWDASGNPTAVGPGTDGQVLTSTGAGSPPAFEAIPAGVGGATGVDFNDNVKIRSGTGNDLEIYHNGSHSYIKNTTGELILRDDTIKLKAVSTGDTYLTATDGGAVSLKYDNSTKFETTSSGALVTGSLEATDDLILSGANANLRWDKSDDALEFMSQGKAVFGSSDNATIKHSGSDFLITNGTGTFDIKCTSGTGAGEGAIKFHIGSDTEALSINNSGGLNHTSSTDNMITSSIAGAIRMQLTHTGGGDVSWSNPSSGSASYSTSSDYRLKQNVIDLPNAWSTVKALKPYEYKWKHNTSRTSQGFFAHEVIATIPNSEAGQGTKDAVDSDSNPIYQQIDYSKLVPVLTKALQEAITEIETLKTKVAALEAK